MILAGGPEHLYLDQTPAPGPRATGFNDGLAGNEPEPCALYDRADRASYFQGHIRGTLTRRAQQHPRGHFTPTARKDVA